MTEDNELKLSPEAQKAIIHALLIGLDSYAEIERLSDEVQINDYMASDKRIPDAVRPIHPTGSVGTIAVFASALRYMQQV